MSEQRIPFYRDKRADMLTRDELLEAYCHACDELERMRDWNRQGAEMDALFASARRALATQEKTA